jgi:hypothetical protein
MEIGELLARHGVTQTQMSAAVGMELPTLNRKIRGRRRWTVDEANRALAFLRSLDESLTLDQLFGEPKRKRARKAA